MRLRNQLIGVIGAFLATSALPELFFATVLAKSEAPSSSKNSIENCKKEASQKEYEDEVKRLNTLAERFDNGEFPDDYIDTIAYSMVRCLSERGDREKLATITKGVIEIIEEAQSKQFRNYAPYIYEVISRNKRENGDKDAAKKILKQGYESALKKGVPTAAVSIMTTLIQQHSNDKESKEAIALGEKAYKLAKEENIESTQEWKWTGYYLFSMTAVAYFEEQRYIDSLLWRERAADEVRRRSKDRGQINDTDIEDMAYQMLSSASSYGMLQKPDKGLEKIQELEQWIGGDCQSRIPIADNRPNSTVEWCNSLKSWLYSVRANQNWGVDYKKVVSDYRLSLSYTSTEKEKQFTAITSLANALYSSQKIDMIRESLSLYENALTLISDERQTASKRYITTSLATAFSLNELDRYDEAIRLINQAIQLAHQHFPNEKELMAELEGGLATVLYNKNDVNKDFATFAENELELARKNKQASGNPDLYVSDRLLMLSAVRLDEGRYLEAISLAKDSVKEKTLVLRGRLGMLATDNREEFTEYALGDLEAIYSYSHLLPQATELAFFARLNLHGLIEEVARRQTQANSQLSTNQKEILKQIQDINRDLSRSDISQAEKASLADTKKSKERLLYSQISLEKPFFIESNQVSQALGDQEALVEVKKFRKWDRSLPRSKRWGKYEYQLYILNSKGKLTLVRLGDADQVDARISEALVLSQPNPRNGQLKVATKTIEAWSPIISSVMENLKGYRKIYLSPDGELHKVPWNAFQFLQNKQHGNTIESIELVTTGRDLIPSRASVSSQDKPVIVASPSFNDRPTKAINVQETTRSSPRSGFLENEIWSELPYTKREGEQVFDKIGGSLLIETEANTTNVKRISSPSILHIATHGFFFDPGSEKNPMIASGLVFAGANTKQVDNGEDSFLTSLEVSSMNLEGTHLVVLSACSTGDGLVKNGEGVYGLRRALKVAGAKYSLLSLWKVDDAATAAFMSEFYDRISSGLDPINSLYATQQAFLNSPIAAWRHPYYWAAWQLVSSSPTSS